jgi:hypothetical protein
VCGLFGEFCVLVLDVSKEQEGIGKLELEREGLEIKFGSKFEKKQRFRGDGKHPKFEPRHLTCCSV